MSGERKGSFFGAPKRKGSVDRGRAFSKDATQMRKSVFQQPVMFDGYLQKMASGKIKRWQSRYFQLSGHYLKYYENKELQDDANLKGVVDLCHVKDCKEGAKPQEFLLEMSDGAVVQLQSHSPENAKLWVSEIKSTLKSLKEVSGGGGQPAAAAAASTSSNPYAKENYTKANDTSSKPANPYAKENYYSGDGGSDGGVKARSTSTDKRVSAVLRAKRKQQREAIFSEKVDVDQNRQKIKHPKTAGEEGSIKGALEHHFLFQNLPPAMKQECVDAMEKMQVASGDTIIRQGDMGDFFYVVAEGSYEIVVSSVTVDTIGPGGNFGELALLYNCPRAATVQAASTGSLWRLDRNTFRQTLAASANSETEVVVSALKAAELLKDLEHDQVTRLADVVQPVHFGPGEKIINKGDAGSVFYIIKSGTVACTLSNGEIFKLVQGQHFGERALVSNEPRAADVAAEGDVVCMALERQSFEEVLGSLQQVLDTNTTRKVISAVPLLKNLNPREQARLAQVAQLARYNSGTPIIKQGETGNKFYIIKRGEVKITHTVGKKEEQVAKLKQGDYFGEMALLHDEKRQASVIADGECECYFLDRDQFTELLGPLSKRLESESSRRNTDLKDHEQKAKAAKSGGSGQILLSDINILGVLGAGTFGKVKLVQHKVTKTPYALKILRKAHIKKYKQQTNVMCEKNVMVQARHPFILQLVSTMKDDQHLYMLLDLCLGGELFTYLHCSGRPTEYVSDSDAKFYGACVLDAFEYLHDKDIIYRDLKPENLMLDAEGYIKVVDFGFAKVVTTRTYTLCGTPEYLAPELVTGRGHNKGVDYWAFGVLIYEMVAGYSPFAGPETPEQSVIVRNILRGKCSYPKHIENPQCVDLVKKLLVKEQSRRLGCLKGGSRDIKSHAWFKSIDWQVLRAKTKRAPWVPPIKDPLDTSHFDPWDEEDDDNERYVDDGSGWDDDF